jgi:NADPH-dependent ferric siderophore reductase
MTESSPTPSRARREPPRFRQVPVRRVERLGAWMVRVTVGGPDLEGFAVEQPGASMRLLLPDPGNRQPVIPTWNGNEFLLPDGRRPPIRTLTPRRSDPAALELDLEIVVHGGGAASDWVGVAELGDTVGVSGPGRGYVIEDAPGLLLAGDETAIPAISQLLEIAPAAMTIQAHIEVAHPDARLALPAHPNATITWYDLPAGAPPGDALVAAVKRAHFGPEERIWVAGEAAAVQRIRRHLFEERAVPRGHATVRGYWKYGRRGEAAGAEG